MNNQPSPYKIITIDYVSFFAFIFPIISWVMYALFVLFQRIDPADFYFPAFLATITIIAICVIGWRIRTINKISNNGYEIPATISNIIFFRDRYRVDYVYTLQGIKYISSNYVMKVRKTQKLQVGEQVIVIVDPEHPKYTFIRDIYI
jgi:hypothetical protein